MNVNNLNKPFAIYKPYTKNKNFDVVIKQNKISIIKEKFKNFYKKMQVYFKEYCENSTLHGFRYLGEENRCLIERILWLIIIIVSMILCYLMILKVWDKWDITPVIISISQSPTTIWQIPHPAVTICPETKQNETRQNFLENLKWQIMYKNSFVDLYKNFNEGKQPKTFKQYCEKIEEIDLKATYFFYEVCLKYDRMIENCKWGGDESCKHLISLSLTENGICLSLNTLDFRELYKEEFQSERYLNYVIQSEWSLNDGYHKANSFYPRRPKFAGISDATSITLKEFYKDMEKYSQGNITGYKIFLHNPEEAPGLTPNYFRVVINEEINIIIEPNMMMTSNELRNYSPSKRYCYFPGEKFLKFFKIYTQLNCEFECLTNHTFKKCGCVQFHMPQSLNTQICKSENTECVINAEKDLLLQELEKEIKQSKNSIEIRRTSKKCDCLPACTSLEYNAEEFRATINWSKVSTETYNEEQHRTKIVIYYRNVEFTSFIRSELFGSTDFLANCGGLLGLFMGFSFMSLFEIAYFFTIRLWHNIKGNEKLIKENNMNDSPNNFIQY